MEADRLTGPVTLCGEVGGRIVQEEHRSLDRAVSAAYWAVANRRMAPKSIVDVNGEELLKGGALTDAMWLYWGETEY